jgi:hypothetical protein
METAELSTIASATKRIDIDNDSLIDLSTPAVHPRRCSAYLVATHTFQSCCACQRSGRWHLSNPDPLCIRSLDTGMRRPHFLLCPDEAVLGLGGSACHYEK